MVALQVRYGRISPFFSYPLFVGLTSLLLFFIELACPPGPFVRDDDGRAAKNRSTRPRLAF